MQPAYNDKLLERMKSLRGKGWEFFLKKKGQRVLRPKSRNYDFFSQTEQESCHFIYKEKNYALH